MIDIQIDELAGKALGGDRKLWTRTRWVQNRLTEKG